jgi:hypothetical protein
VYVSFQITVTWVGEDRDRLATIAPPVVTALLRDDGNTTKICAGAARSAVALLASGLSPLKQ